MFNKSVQDWVRGRAIQLMRPLLSAPVTPNTITVIGLLFTGVLALLAVIALALNRTVAADEKTPTIKEIMKKAHNGDSSLLGQLRGELRDDEPEWAEIQKQTRELVTLATSLGKNKPPRGEMGSWDKLTKQYLEKAKALDGAAKKKDKKSSQVAFAKLRGSCTDCHNAHKAKSEP